MNAKNIHVIGAGLGGLAISCLLASDGHRVTVFEKNDSPGGKINQVIADGFRFDTGPSLMTMPFVLKELFERCGFRAEDYINLKPVEPICRYFYQDGTVFTSYQDLDNTLDELSQLAPVDVDNYIKFLDYSSNLYQRTKDAFLFNPLYGLKDLGNLNLLDFFRIDAFHTVSDRVDEYFKSPYLRKFFKRFTTYNGSSPYQAPATLNVIPYVELSMGGYYVDGGMYAIVTALHRLAMDLGVEFRFNSDIKRIKVLNKQVESVIDSEGEKHTADLVVSNSDAAETYLELLGEDAVSESKKENIENLEPSCSGFVLLLGINRRYEQLRHHNIFFSEDYELEFQKIFREKVMPEDPTIYIANTSASNPEHAIEGGSNLFVLVNAPYLSENYNWDEHSEAYASFIISELEKRGLENLSSSIVHQSHITPADFREKYRSNRGSIYGTSSNSRFAAFLRPRNKSREVKGLYLTGGSTHPGGGIPLVILSAFHAMELIRRYE
ncbi:phytoene desaturase [Balneolaceae bacterium YR4-1]|uniref:Phytoene desaturase n=1 Tax=Halalkalibaculum roseum TaxID=2709311 RepID=A0A6M1SMG2_9BACT|nr:phytoene desaturase family protein [Halalkalibaculum roseum]NGP76511.1 phytoene desaturase [Halalkalibaculum roseum]